MPDEPDEMPSQTVIKIEAYGTVTPPPESEDDAA